MIGLELRHDKILDLSVKAKIKLDFSRTGFKVFLIGERSR